MADIAGRYYNPAGRNIAGGLNDILNSISRRESGQVLRQREQQSMDIIDRKQSRKAMAEDAYMISELLKQNDVPGAEAVALDRIKAGMQAGKDMSHTQSLLQAIRQNPAEAQRDAALVVSKAEKFGYTSQRPTQFGSSSRYKDSEGNIYEVTQGRDPSTGQVVTKYSAVTPGAPETPVGPIQAMGSSGLTSEEQIRLAGGKKAAEKAVERSDNILDKLPSVRLAITNIDSAIEAIDEGAQTGVIMSRLPSVRASSIKLDNLRGRLGLDVISGTTFGALSEAELKFALSTALPTTLEPPELRTWLLRKKVAQEKLAAELENAAIYLGTPGNTSAGYLERRRNDLQGQPAATEAPVVNENKGVDEISIESLVEQYAD